MAYDWDGTDDYMEAPLGANYDVPKTLACWFNSDSTNVNRHLVGLYAGTVGTLEAPSLALRITSTALVQARSDNTGGSNASSTTATYSLNTWHHGAAVFASSSSRTAYLDGVAGTENTTTRATGGALDNLILGSNSGATLDYNGRLAEIAVWDVALDAAEIAALAKGFRPSLIRPHKLLWYLPLVREIQEVRSGLAITSSGPIVAVHTRRIA